MMTIRKLRIFIAVCNHLSMSRASEELFISQSSISQTISEIEEEYGVKLFDRLAKKIYITAAGELLLNYARQVIYSYDQLDQGMRNISENILLRIGAAMTVGTCLINPLLNKFYEIYPNAEIEIDISNTSTLENKILNSELDVAIVQDMVKSKDILCHKIWTDELIFVCSPHHKLAGAEIKLSELNGEAFIMRELGSGTRRILENALKENDTEIVCSWTCSNTDAIKHALEYGRGIALISELLVKEELQSRMLSRITIKGQRFPRDFSLILHKNKHISQPLGEFIQLCKSIHIEQLTNMEFDSKE